MLGFTVGEMFRLAALRYPDNPCFIFNGARVTYKEVNIKVNRVANYLLGMGIQKGDRVAIIQTNCPQYMEIVLACAKIGAIFVPINYRLKPGEMEYIMDNSGATAVFVGERYKDSIEEIKPNLPHLKHFICIERPIREFYGYEEAVSGQASTEPSERVEPIDLFSICYTSGTTGRPKGAMISNHGISLEILNFAYEQRIIPIDVYLTPSPLYHVAGVLLILSPLYRGATAIIIEQFTPDGVLDVIEKERVTICFLVPAMLNFILQQPQVEKRDTSSVKLIPYGAAPMQLELLKRAMLVFNCGFMNMFGQTECTPITILQPEEHIVDGSPEEIAQLHSVGKPAMHVEVKIVDENGKEVPLGEVGEIISKSNQVMLGYWNNPEATKEAIRDGWLYTGDLGRFTERGYVELVDRKKDMLIRGGVNIYPAEIEEVLYAHPKILEAAVIGVPDETWGEAVQAIVVLKNNEHASEEEIITWCQERMASYRKPSNVEFIDQLPRNPSGKVLKMVLRERFWSGKDRKI